MYTYIVRKQMIEQVLGLQKYNSYTQRGNRYIHMYIVCITHLSRATRDSYIAIYIHVGLGLGLGCECWENN